MNALIDLSNIDLPVDDVMTQNALMFAALQTISNTDCRYGLGMKEVASAAVNQILESRIDARIKAARSIA